MRGPACLSFRAGSVFSLPMSQIFFDNCVQFLVDSVKLREQLMISISDDNNV